MKFRAVAAAVLAPIALLLSEGAHAGSVFLRANGASEGQGFTFYLGSTCYIFTAEHVVAGASRVEVVTADARRFQADVAHRDPGLDLALLKLRGEITMDILQMCEAKKGATLRVPEVLKNPRYPVSLVLQRVPSRAGGVDRANMRLAAADDDSPWIMVSPSTSSDVVMQGDSGATLWNEGGMARGRGGESQGELIGMVVSVEGETTKVLRSDKIYEAVHNLLWPIRVDALKFAPDNVRMIQFARGEIPTDSYGTPQRSVAWHTGLATVNMIFDLGDRDTVVSGITINNFSASSFFRDRDPAMNAIYKLPQIAVQVSSERPDGRTRWQDEPCDRATALQFTCTFRVPKIIRGARIQFTGAVQHLSGVTFRTERE